MSVHVVGVHGIWQGDTNAEKLSADWAGALTKGQRLHHGPDFAIPALTVSHYGHIFRRRSRRLGPVDTDPFDESGPVTGEEEAFILDTLAPYIPEGVAPEALQTETLGLGIPYIPRPVAQTLAAVDRKAGKGAGRALLWLVRQVYRYLHDDDIGSRIRDIVKQELHRPGPRVVIAHSLGSVIVFDMLTRSDMGPGPDGLDTLVTCGSPLAWPTVRRSLGQAGQLNLPSGVGWLNLYAYGDIVTQGHGLAPVAPGVRDEAVRNGVAEPHSVLRYLDKQPLADLIAKLGIAQ